MSEKISLATIPESMKRISFDDIELGPVLGTGTVGTVYRGTIKSSNQEVAVKILQQAISDDELVRSRFKREMSILERLHHPHIIRYFGGGEHHGQLFFTMELLDQGNLRDLLQRYGAMAWQEVASIGRQISSALQYAHNHGIIHRDLKPGNLFLDSRANVKLGDFGIARDTKDSDLTSQGLTVGTHAYMSPEQITGELHITGKADLYSLGCLLFELLTGHKPFDGTNFAMLFEQHLRKSPPRVDEFVPGCPVTLSNVIDQLLQKSPADRPFNARAVQGVMHELLASDGVVSTGVVIGPLPKLDGLRDIGAASLVDPGMKSLARKLQPEVRPELTWRTAALLSFLVVAIIVFATMVVR